MELTRWSPASLSPCVTDSLIQLPLTWEAAQVLLEFYHPSFLPAVEENKALTPEVSPALFPSPSSLSLSLSSCLSTTDWWKSSQTMGKVERVGSICHTLFPFLAVIPLPVIATYIEGRVESLPDPSPSAPHTTIVSEIFYLLADDALKSNDFL